MGNRLFGIIPPLVTPLKENGELDIEGLERLIEYQLAGGVNGIFIMGSCGEGSCVPGTLRKKMLIETNRIAAGRIPILTGVLETSTDKVVEAVLELEAFGLEYAVITPPFYLAAANQEEIIRHYERIAEKTHVKLVVYNIPPYVHTKILPETMVQLAGMEKIVAFKDSTGDWADFQKALILKERYGFTLLSGNEDLCGAALLLGADGCVPCLANAYPALYVKLFQAAGRKDIAEVFGYQKEIISLRESFKCGKYWISIVKYLCTSMGIIKEFVSPPQDMLANEEKEEINKIIAWAVRKEIK